MGTKAKHFRVKYHFLKDVVKDSTISLKYCPTHTQTYIIQKKHSHTHTYIHTQHTDDMIADFLTKPINLKIKLPKLCARRKYNFF